MSCYIVFYKKGAKHMRPIKNREEYMAIRADQHNLDALTAARMGNKLAKSRLTQMNYSCYPNKDGKLRGSIYPTQTVAMDIDIAPSDDSTDLLSSISERILSIASRSGNTGSNAPNLRGLRIYSTIGIYGIIFGSPTRIFSPQTS